MACSMPRTSTAPSGVQGRAPDTQPAQRCAAADHGQVELKVAAATGGHGGELEQVRRGVTAIGGRRGVGDAVLGRTSGASHS